MKCTKKGRANEILHACIDCAEYADGHGYEYDEADECRVTRSHYLTSFPFKSTKCRFFNDLEEKLKEQNEWAEHEMLMAVKRAEADRDG